MPAAKVLAKVAISHPNTMSLTVWAIGLLPFFIYWYIRHNDRAIARLPPEATVFSPKRFTDSADILRLAKREAIEPRSIIGSLPPKTGRRYIVIGGSGFLGGWMVLHLMARGEDPRYIRIVDLRPPVRDDLTSGAAKEVQFKKTDISDAKSVEDAFTAPWPAGVDTATEITVFHTAASIRFYERFAFLIDNSAKVNVQGTQNIINAVRLIGASALVYTSSGSIGVRRSRLWLFPWEKQPKHAVQIINDEDGRLPKQEHMFSNYAVTKFRAERLVRDADGTPSGAGILRTGCLRPGNAIYGPGGDRTVGAYLVRVVNPTWISNTLQSFAYVENVSLAHLCYEQRLIELSQGGQNPDIGGQAFTITDAGRPTTYGDITRILYALSNGQTVFPEYSPTMMLFLSHIIEAFHLTRHFLVSCAPFLGRLIPAMNNDLVNLQPSLFALMMVHLILDDFRARLPPQKGGLGYKPVWDTFSAVCKTFDEHQRNGGDRSRPELGGVTFGFGQVGAESGVQKVNEKVHGLGVEMHI